MGISEILTDDKSDGMLDDVRCSKVLDTLLSVEDLVGCVDGANKGIKDGMPDGD
jgi:hypothetical protein